MTRPPVSGIEEREGAKARFETFCCFCVLKTKKETPVSVEEDLKKKRNIESRKNSAEMDHPTTVMCSLVAIDYTNFCYKVCSVCERTLPETDDSICKFCNFNFSTSPPYKRLFRLLVSIATDKKVKTLVCFDRAARVLFGCSADEFSRFANLNPLAAVTAGQILEGEMFRITLTKPKNGNAQHLRVSSIVPLRSGFQPVIVTLREYHGQRAP